MIKLLKELMYKNRTSISDTNTNEMRKTMNLISGALMVEVMAADHDFNSEEELKLKEILLNRFEIPESEIKKISEQMKKRADDATSLYEYTSLINENFNREEKLDLIRNLWAIAFADKILDRYEDSVIRRVCELTYVSHSDFIKTKLEMKNKKE
ncbi:MAG: hypothetical protein CL926_07260 [Deltaproteobacteria bacterium]|jgi:uncharacterized tellurite resistance protein B-like protein|nr:hypothetical protein [Deltaproteobacteria bacterium]|tara:strand:- start:144 stop:605 length:462 start_codon:yes stop_codon:yes gene_type:complete